MKKSISLKHFGLPILLALGLAGCNGRDRFEECFGSGDPVPDYEITAYDAVSGQTLCWTAYHEPTILWETEWSYEGICEYTFEEGAEFSTTDITITAPGYEQQVVKNSPKPGPQCTLRGEQTIVDVYLTPITQP